MFLDSLLTRNPELVDAAADLHRRGAIPPDTYVMDLDAIESNATLLAAEADRLGLTLWFVVKQLGRNPELIRAIARHIPKYAAIDAPEARTLHAAGARAGNLGHLVQIPRRALPEMLAWRPETVTVFDVDNARAVSDAARARGFVQDVLVRLEGAEGAVYPGQEGGVPLGGIDDFAAAVEQLPGVRIAGVTAFPCVLCDPATGTPRPTANFELALKARESLTSRGYEGLKLSAPSATSMASLPSSPSSARPTASPATRSPAPPPARPRRRPAREARVRLRHRGRPYPRRRPARRVRRRLLPPRAHRFGTAAPLGRRLAVQDAPAENIDYYRLLDAPAPGQAVAAGDTALLAFRTQIFVTRSTVAVVAGLSSGSPRLMGLYDAQGRAL